MDVELILEQWVRWLHTLLHIKSPIRDPDITENHDQWPVNMALRDRPTMQTLIHAICSLANGMDVGPGGMSIEPFKIAPYGNPALRQRPLDIVMGIRKGIEVLEQRKDAILKVLHEKKEREECGNHGGISLLHNSVGCYKR